MGKKVVENQEHEVGRVGLLDLLDSVVDDVQENTVYSLTKEEIKEVARSTLNCMVSALTDHHAVVLPNMFSLVPVFKQARVGRNPKEPTKSVDIPAHWSAKLKLSKALRADMN